MRAWILSIGNELLIGKTINTNAAWLARKLTVLGYEVRREISIPDEDAEEIEVFRDALSRGIELIVSTGGLGPTFDDKTSESLAKALNREYVVNDEALNLVKAKFLEKGLELTPPRLKQAMMPRGAEAIPNPVGTAPGIWVREWQSIIVALPGVPAEMQGMFEEHVEPRLMSIGPRPRFVEASFTVKGVPEAEAAPIIEKAMRMGNRVYIKSHPKGHEIGSPFLEIHVYASSSNEEEARMEVERTVNYLREELRRRGGDVE